MSKVAYSHSVSAALEVNNGFRLICPELSFDSGLQLTTEAALAALAGRVQERHPGTALTAKLVSDNPAPGRVLVLLEGTMEKKT